MRNFYSKIKYNNHKVSVNGTTYDSKKEAYRHHELKLLERAGEISSLEIQVKYTLQESFYIIKNNKKSKQQDIEYIADFIYIENGKKVVEDLKSEITEKDSLYRLKRKLLLSSSNDFDVFREIIFDKFGKVTVNNYERKK